jgi:hypothetical protein
MSNLRSGLELVFCIVAACATLGCPLESVRSDVMCAGRCGEYLDDMACGCDALCEDARDCCPGYEAICAPDKDEAQGPSPTCEPAASGSSQTCDLPGRDVGGGIKVPPDTLQSNGLK